MTVKRRSHAFTKAASNMRHERSERSARGASRARVPVVLWLLMPDRADFSLCKDIVERISRVIVGKRPQIELLLVSLLSEGHVLLEDLPGSGKTILAKTIARAIGGSFKRIQFTPDLLPSDVTGFNIYDQKSGQFRMQTGPVMAWPARRATGRPSG